MKVRTLWLFVLAGLAAAWAGLQLGRWQEHDEPQAAATVINQSAVAQLLAAPLATTDGKTTTLNAWHGKTLVVNFWATWCPPCREEMPAFSKMQTQFASRNVQFVGLAIDDAANVAEFTRKLPVSYPLFVAPPQATVLLEALGNAQQGLPFTLVINPAGKVVFQHLGPLTEAQLTKKLDLAP